MKILIRRIWNLLSVSDPVPVMALCAIAFLILGLTLDMPGNTFDLPSMEIMHSVLAEEVATVLAFLLAGAGFGAILLARGVLRFVAMVYVLAFIFIGVTFILTVPYSTGSTYFTYAIGAGWVFLRGAEDD